MRFFLFFTLGLLLSNISFAQASTDEASEIRFFTQKFKLSTAQTEKLTRIIGRKYAAFEQIQAYRSKELKYFGKLKSLYEGTNHSIQLLMNTIGQEEVFRLYQIDQRRNKGQIIKQYRKGGMSAKKAENQYYVDVFFTKE